MKKIKKITLLLAFMTLFNLSTNAMENEVENQKISLNQIYKKPQILKTELQSVKNLMETYEKNLEDKITKNQNNIYFLEKEDKEKIEEKYENEIIYHMDEIIKEFKELKFLDTKNNIMITSKEKKDTQMDFIVFFNIYQYLTTFLGWLKDIENGIENEKINKHKLNISTTKIIMDKFNTIKNELNTLFQKFKNNKQITPNMQLYDLTEKIYKKMNEDIIPSIEDSIENLKNRQKILKFSNNSKVAVIEFWMSLEEKLLNTLKIVEKIYNSSILNASYNNCFANKNTKKNTLENIMDTIKKDKGESIPTPNFKIEDLKSDMDALLDFLETSERGLNKLDSFCKKYADFEKNPSPEIKSQYESVCELFPYMINIISTITQKINTFLYSLENPEEELEIKPINFVDSYLKYKNEVLDIKNPATPYIIKEEQNNKNKELTYNNYIDFFNNNIKNLIHKTNYNSLKLLNSPLSTEEKSKSYCELIKTFNENKEEPFILKEEIKEKLSIYSVDRINVIEYLLNTINNSIFKIFKFQDYINKSIYKNEFKKSEKNDGYFAFSPTSPVIYKLENCLLNLALTYEQMRKLLNLIQPLELEGARDKNYEDKILNKQSKIYLETYKYFKHKLDKAKDYLLKQTKKFEFIDVKNNKNKKSKKKSNNDKLVASTIKNFSEQTNEHNGTKINERTKAVKNKLYFCKALTENVAFYYDSYYKSVPNFIKNNVSFEIFGHVLNIEENRLNVFLNIIDEDDLKDNNFFINENENMEHNIYQYKNMLKNFEDGLKKIRERNKITIPLYDNIYNNDYSDNYNYYDEKIKIPFNINKNNNNISILEQKKYLQYLYAFLLNILHNENIFKEKGTNFNINKSFFEYITKPNDYFNMISSFINKEDSTTFIENPLFNKDIFNDINKFKDKLSKPIKQLTEDGIINFEEDFEYILEKNLDSFLNDLEKVALIAKNVYYKIHTKAKNFDKEIYHFVVGITRFLGHSKTLLSNFKTYIKKNKNFNFKAIYTTNRNEEFNNKYDQLCDLYNLLDSLYSPYKKLKEKMRNVLTNSKSLPNFNKILEKDNLDIYFNNYNNLKNKNISIENINENFNNGLYNEDYFENFRFPIEFEKFEKPYKFLNDYIFKRKFLLSKNHLKLIYDEFPEITELFIFFTNCLKHLTFTSFDLLNFLPFFEYDKKEYTGEEEEEEEFEELEGNSIHF